MNDLSASPPSTHTARPHHSCRRKQHRRQKESRLNASALLLSTVLLADNPELALGWVHRHSSTSTRHAGTGHHGSSPASAPPAVAPSPVPRLRLLHLLALQGQRSGCRLPSRLSSGAPSAELGQSSEALAVEALARAAERTAVAAAVVGSTGAAVARARPVEKRSGGGKWTEAIEQLEKERGGGLTPVSCCFVHNPRTHPISFSPAPQPLFMMYACISRATG